MVRRRVRVGMGKVLGVKVRIKVRGAYGRVKGESRRGVMEGGGEW